MPRYFIQLSYDGTNYHGWQVQENAHTVQAEVQNALATVLRSNVEMTGAGRTDTGVHAKQMFAHFDIEKPIEDPAKVTYRLNSVLPDDIAIQDMYPVPDDAHARFDATGRTYEYHIYDQKDPFLINKAYYFCHELDIDRMNDAAAYFMQHDDFTSFCKLHSDTATNVCKIERAGWEKTGSGWKFTIRADRFLRNMVRAIVGTLLEVGRGKLKPEDVDKIIEAKDRSSAGFSVPAHGLYLTEVNYPEHIRKNKNL